MKLSLALAAIVLGGLAAQPGAADPTSCADPCLIDASVSPLEAPGFDPAVAFLQNATHVTWHSADSISHVMADVGTAGACITDAVSDGSNDSDAILFEVWGGALRATNTATEETHVCGNAKSTGTGTFVVTYKCLLHVSMNGAIVVGAT